VWVPVALVAILAIGTYWVLGRPDLPAQPLADRGAETGSGMDLPTAIKTIEARLAKDPNDLRGWQVLSGAYAQVGRYSDAVDALRKVNTLMTPTADSLTDLGEALMMRNGGSVAGEPLDLFQQAAALDPKHVRSRFYVAGEETRAGSYQDAIRDWNALLALGKGDEPWMTTARNGLAFAQAQLNPSAAAQPALPNEAQIAAMVDGLDAKLKAQMQKMADVDPVEFFAARDAYKMWLRENVEFGVHYVYNPFGRIIMNVASNAYENYPLRAYDGAAFQRLVRLGYEIRNQKVEDKAVPSFMQRNPQWASHPVDGRTFVWDEKKREIVVQTLGQQPEGRRFSIPVWRAAPRN